MNPLQLNSTYSASYEADQTQEISSQSTSSSSVEKRDEIAQRTSEVARQQYAQFLNNLVISDPDNPISRRSLSEAELESAFSPIPPSKPPSSLFVGLPGFSSFADISPSPITDTQYQQFLNILSSDFPTPSGISLRNLINIAISGLLSKSREIEILINVKGEHHLLTPDLMNTLLTQLPYEKRAILKYAVLCMKQYQGFFKMDRSNILTNTHPNAQSTTGTPHYFLTRPQCDALRSKLSDKVPSSLIEDFEILNAFICKGFGFPESYIKDHFPPSVFNRVNDIKTFAPSNVQNTEEHNELWIEECHKSWTIFTNTLEHFVIKLYPKFKSCFKKCLI